jgi:hypothetical protein
VFVGNCGFAAASGAGDVENEVELAKMREIDPQSGDLKSDARLSEALRGFAALSGRGAPAEVGAGLAAAFRKHHARRRRVSIGAIAAAFAVVVGLMSLGSRSTHQVPAKEIVQEQPNSIPVEVPQPAIIAKTITALPPPVTKRVKPKATNNIAASRRQFLALPGYDPTVPADELHIVRVQVPASALWQMGAPVSPEFGAHKFMADFVVSQDGTPYAVRLVQ